MPKSPLDDKLDREDFYRDLTPDADEEEDYELLPPDAEIIEAEQRRARQFINVAKDTIDVNALYEGPATIDVEDLKDYLEEFRFRYTTRHLLIAMTVLAVFLVLGRFLFGGWGTVLFLGVFTLLASSYGFIRWQEHKRQKEWEQKREELYERHKNRHDKAAD